MRRYTTPTLKLVAQKYDPSTKQYSPIDLTDYELWVTVRQGETEIEFHDPTAEYTTEGTELEVTLTQEQTAGLHVGAAEVQLNWMTPDGVRGATDIGRWSIDRNLLEEVLAYGL